MKPIAAVLVVALISSACGGSGPASTGVASVDDLGTAPSVEAAGAGVASETTSSTVGALSAEEAMLAFTQCLREQGVDIDDPIPDSEGNLRLSRPQGVGEGDQDVFRAAREECAELIDGVSFGFRERDLTELQDTLYEYASCMRENGFDMPDPDFSSGGPGSGGGGGALFGALDRDDPVFQAADGVCRAVFGGDGPVPGGGFGPRGGGPGGGPGGGSGGGSDS